MTKLERLLKTYECQNDPKIATVEQFKRTQSRLAHHVYYLWKIGRLDANIKVRGDHHV